MFKGEVNYKATVLHAIKCSRFIYVEGQGSLELIEKSRITIDEFFRCLVHVCLIVFVTSLGLVSKVFC